MTPQHVVIAGGSGHIGRALSSRLLAEGRQVTVLSRRPEQARGLLPGVRMAHWDPTQVGEWALALTGVDAIVQLSGESLASGRWTGARKRRFHDSRVTASRVLAEAVLAIDPRPRVFVQGSAVGIYGDAGDEVVDEDTPPGRGFLAELGVAWEEASAGVEAAGLRRAVARTGLVLDPAGPMLSRMTLAFRLFVGGPLGDGRQWMPWIHPADEVGALLFLVDHPEARGPFNLNAPGVVTNRELSAQLGRALGRPSWLPAPGPALRLLIGEMGQVALEGQRAEPRRLLELGYEFEFPTLDAAFAELF